MFVLFREIVNGILSGLLQHSWIMNSAQNRCAFVRAEYVQILVLLLQWANDHRLPVLDSEEDPAASDMVTDITAVPRVSDNVEHFNCSDLKFSDEAVDNEMRLLLESDDAEDLRYTQVRSSNVSVILRYLLLVSIL